MGDDLALAFPATRQAPRPVAAGQPRNIPDTDVLRPARVLLVDDRLPDLILAKRHLLGRSGLGCDLTTARSSHEGLDLMLRAVADGRPFDLVLLDINMPGDDGFVMLDHIRGYTCLRKTPAIMCTGSGDPFDRRQALLRGAVGYIVKPASLEGIRDVLELLPLFDVTETDNGLRLMTVAPDPQGWERQIAV